MNKGLIKYFALIMIVFLVGAIVVGCSSNNEGANQNNKQAANQSNNQEPAGEASAENSNSGYQEKYDPPVTLTTAWGIDPAISFKNDETIEDNVAKRWALETFGIDIKSLWSVTATDNAFETKMRLSMSAGQEMPEIVTIGDNLLAQDLIDSGIYREVGSLFDEYASDIWKEAMNLDSNVWNAYTRNGERMGIPVLDYAYNNDYLLWIRQDWLDALDLSSPKTLEELETVMEAFKNQNPDGLKPNEVTPLSVGFKNSFRTWMGDPSWVFGAYGTIPSQWNLAEDGTLEYGSVHPGIKDGLVKLKEWRDKGYIPSEAALWDEGKTAEPAVAGTAGIIPGPNWMSGWPLSDTLDNVESAIWKPHPIPAGPDGTAGRHGTPFVNGVTLIHKDIKHPEAFFTYQNYLFEHLADPPLGGVFENGLFEGYDYAIGEDGSYLYLEDVPGGDVRPNRYFLVRDGARNPETMINALLYLAEGNEPETFRQKEVVNTFGAETPNAAVVLLQQEEISMKDLFVGPPTETMKSRLDYLNKLEFQTFNEIIYGEKPADSFDEFVKNWKSSGGEDITSEVNEWYSNVEN